MEKSLYELTESKIKFFRKFNKYNKYYPLIDYNWKDIRYFKPDNILWVNDQSLVNGPKLLFNKGYHGEIYIKFFNNRKYVVKKTRYNKVFSNDFNLTSRSENVELFIMKLLSYFVVNHICYHFVLPITVIRGNDIHKLTEYNENFFYKSLYIHTEYINYGDLQDLIESRRYNSNFYRIIFFQIIYTLAIIYEYFPRFKHNDLKANNILIEKVNVYQKFIKYVFKNNTYFIPNIGFIVKIWDFDVAEIPGTIVNYAMYNTTSYNNKYIDLFIFFHDIRQKIKDKETLKFINNVAPKNKFKYDDDTGRLAEDIEYTTPSKLLGNNYFKYLKKNNLNLNFLFKN